MTKGRFGLKGTLYIEPFPRTEQPFVKREEAANNLKVFGARQIGRLLGGNNRAVPHVDHAVGVFLERGVMRHHHDGRVVVRA